MGFVMRQPVWRRILLAAGMVLLLLTVFTHRGPQTHLIGEFGEAGRTTFYVVDNGFHTDIALPRDAVEASGGALAQAVRRLPPGPWVLVGWGDEAFFMAQGMSAARIVDGLRAMFAPNNRSVIRLVAIGRHPAQEFWPRDRMTVQVRPAGLAALIRRVDASLETPLRTAPPRSGAFFASRESFSLVHLCNHWTGQVLQAAGLPDTPVIDTVPGGLRLALRLDPGARAALDEADTIP